MTTHSHIDTQRETSPFSRLTQWITEVRQSHALEHATIHVLSQRCPGVYLVGRSTAKGFYLYGEVPTLLVADAASEALARLQAGETMLAIHPRCGTNLVTGSILAGIASLLVTSRRRRPLWEHVPNVFLAISLALFLAQPLGYTIQQRFTTSTEVSRVRIASINKRSWGRQTAHFIALERE